MCAIFFFLEGEQFPVFVRHERQIVVYVVCVHVCTY